MKYLLGILIVTTSYADSVKALSSLGYSVDKEVVKTIKQKAAKYGIKPDLMISIAALESSMNTKAVRINTNGTVDYGLFQINSINREFCNDLDIQTVKGNTECAARLLVKHKSKKDVDSIWYCRYHSKTPSKKLEYCDKLKQIRSEYEWQMKTLSLVQTST
jgi:lysozyme-related protein Hpa2